MNLYPKPPHNIIHNRSPFSSSQQPLQTLPCAHAPNQPCTPLQSSETILCTPGSIHQCTPLQISPAAALPPPSIGALALETIEYLDGELPKIRQTISLSNYSLFQKYRHVSQFSFYLCRLNSVEQNCGGVEKLMKSALF